MSTLFKNGSLYALGEIVPRVMGFILLPILTKYLSPADYGIISYTTAVMAFMFVLSSLSLNSFVLRYYFEYQQEQDRKRLLGNVFLFLAGINIVQFGFLYLFGPFLISYFGIQVLWDPFFKLAIINNFLEVFTIIPLVMYRVKQQAQYFVMLSVSRVIIQFSLIYYFVVILKLGVVGNYYGQLLPLVLYFFINWYLLYKHAVFKFDFKEIRTGLRFSLPLLPGAVAYLIISLSDRIILERNVSLSALGLYNVAVTFSLALNVIIQSGYRAIEPEIFKQYASSNFEAFVLKIKNIFLFAVYISAVSLALFSQELFYFFTSVSFQNGYGLVPIIVCGVLMAAHNVIYGGILAAEKNTKAIGLSTLFGGILSIALNIAFVPLWGVYAAAIASSLSFLCMSIFLYLSIRSEKTIHREMIAFILYLIIVGILYFWYPIISLFAFFIKIVLLAVASLLLARIFSFNLSVLKHVRKSR